MSKVKVERKFVSRAGATIYANAPLNGHRHFAFTRSELSRMRIKAIRQGVWFKVLSRAERVYVELTGKVVDKVRSRLVTNLLICIEEKLLKATRNKVATNMMGIGREIGQKLSQIAQEWGNLSAVEWMKNLGFLQYLAVMYLNAPSLLQSKSRGPV